MINRSTCIFLFVAILAAPVTAHAEALWSRLSDHLSINGSKTYTFQMLSVTGNEDMYINDNYGFSPRYRNETNLTIMGSLFTGLSLTATLSNNRWNPNDRTMVLNYDRKNTKASLGDITTSLTGNELIPFSKRIKGLAFTHDFGVASITAIASRTKASAKTVAVKGNNTSGPYYLGGTQIVDGSERVKIDDRDIPRSDNSGIPNYTLDIYSGILTFRNEIIVPSTSDISVSFESQSYNTTAGSIYGLRSDVPVGKRAGLGFTYLTQQAGHGNQRSIITEPFHGNNSLSLPYELLYVPLEGTIEIKVDGIPQFSPADYTVNYNLHYVLFTRPIPFSSTILITYMPRPDNAVMGDRSVMGFDARFKVSDDLILSGQFARSSRDSTGAGSGGGAASIRATGKYGKLNFTANLRSIDSKFAPIGTAGFFRNERGGNIDLRYLVNKNFSFFTRIDKFQSPGYSSQTGTLVGTMTTTQSSNGFEWKPDKLPSIKYTRIRSDNSFVDSTGSAQSSDALTFTWNATTLTTTGQISRSSVTRYEISKTDGSIVATDSSVDTTGFGVKYTPGGLFSLSADVSGSNIKSANGSSTNAKNYQFVGNYAPVSDLSLSAIYRVSDSGGNYSTPYSAYGSNITNYYNNSTSLPSYGQKSTSRILSLGWTPSRRFSFDTSYNFGYSEGENNTNTSITGSDIGFSYTPSDILSLRAHSSRQNGSYIGSNGTMSSRIGYLSLSVGPVRKFRLDLNYQKMLSGTILSRLTPDDPLYQYRDSTVNLKSISATLRRDIGSGRDLFVEYVLSNVAGLMSNNKSVLAFGIEYPLNQILGLRIDWRIIDYRDPQNASNNYHANMLNARIGARFR